MVTLDFSGLEVGRGGGGSIERRVKNLIATAPDSSIQMEQRG